VLPFEAALEGVLAINLSQVVGQLERGGDLVRRQEGIAAQGLQSAVEAKGRQTTIFVSLWNTLNAVFARQVAQVVRRWNVARGMQVIESGARDVDKARIKRMRVAKSTLLCIGGLVAILEAAAI